MSRSRSLLPLAVLGLVTLVLYARVVGFGFVGIDDAGYVTDNPRVLSGLSTSNFVWAFTTMAQSNWHPLTWLSLMLDAEIGGASAGVYHATNVLLHLANVWLTYLVFASLTGRRGRSAFVALIFAVHPLHVESVAWIAERKDVLSTSFWLLTMLAWAAYARGPSPGRYALVLGSFAAGLLAKPMLVSLPLVLLALDYWPLGRLASREAWRRALGGWGPLWDKVPLVGLALASSAVTLYAQARGGSVMALEAYPLGVRLANAATAYVAYVAKMFWPAGLAVPYPYDVASLTPLRVAAALSVLVVVSVFAICLGRSRPYLIVGWLWYLLTLVPVIGIVQVGSQPMADRYTYVPLTGLFLIVVWGACDLAERFIAAGERARRLALVAAAAAAGVALAVACWFQIGHWRDAETLFARALRVTDRNAVAHNGLALLLQRDGRLERALEHYREAVAISPDYVDLRINHGSALLDAGRIDEAIAEYETALRLRRNDPLILSNLGLALSRAGRVDRAEQAYREALRADPSHPGVRRRLAAILAERGERDEAVEQLRAAVAADPRDAQQRVDLATLLLEQGRVQEATEQFERALAEQPDHAGAHKNLGVLLAREGRLAEAVEHFEAAVRLAPDDDGARQNLERARAMLGRR